MLIIIISDSAFTNLRNKYWHGAFVILLSEYESGTFGGKVHLIDFSGKKSTRVSKSTFHAELLEASAAAERGELMQLWYSEAFQGLRTGQ